MAPGPQLSREGLAEVVAVVGSLHLGRLKEPTLATPFGVQTPRRNRYAPGREKTPGRRRDAFVYVRAAANVNCALDVRPGTHHIDRVNTPARIEAHLRAHGHAWTGPRRAIVQYLCGTRSHPTAHDVLRAVGGPASSRATVYNTLALLDELGLVRTVVMRPGEVRYDANVEPHHHLHCTACGAVEDVPLHDVSVQVRGSATVAEVRLHGLCGHCTSRLDSRPALT